MDLEKGDELDVDAPTSGSRDEKCAEKANGFVDLMKRLVESPSRRLFAREKSFFTRITFSFDHFLPLSQRSVSQRPPLTPSVAPHAVVINLTTIKLTSIVTRAQSVVEKTRPASIAPQASSIAMNGLLCNVVQRDFKCLRDS